MSDFDDLFKERLRDQSVEVPDDMWSRIQENQAPEDTNKPILLYWKWSIGIIFLLAFIGISFIILKDEKSNNIEVKIDAQPKFASVDPNSIDDLSKLLVASGNFEDTEASISKLFDNSIIATEENKIVSKIDLLFEENESQILEVVDTKIESVLSSSIIKLTARPEKISTSILPSDRNILSFKIAEKSIIYPELELPDYDNKCPKFGKSHHGYYSVELYHGSDFNTKNINARIEEFEDYALDRSDTETRRYSYSNGVKLKWHNNSGLEFGLGIERSVIRERFDFNETAREVRTLISIDTIFASDGTFITSSDTTRVEIPGITQNSVSNSYTSLDIPIYIGYQFELNRWAIGVQAGIYINLLQQQNGRILGLNGKPAWIGEKVDEEQNVFKSKTGLKFDGAISIVYHLTPNVDILAQPYFRYNRHSYTKENYPLEQFYHTAGIRAGVRYNFGF